MSLTNNDAKIVLGMILRGDKQHDIAAWFGENQARIVEVEKGSHGSVSPAKAGELPPRGAPGPKGRKMRAFANKALQHLKAGKLEEAMAVLEDGISGYDKNET